MSAAREDAAARWRRLGTDLALLLFFMVVFYGLVWSFRKLDGIAFIPALAAAVSLTWAVDLAVRRLAGPGQEAGPSRGDGHGQG